MDLKKLLEANKSKIANAKPITRQSIDSESLDRPYLFGENATKPVVEETPKAIFPSNDHIVSIEEQNPTEIQIKTGNKLATKRQQSGNKERVKLATNRQQIDNKATQENRNWQQSDNATGNRTDNKVVTEWQQTDNKLATIIPFSKLVGLQRELILFICNECKNSRSKTTEALTLEYIAKALQRSNGAVKTTLQRLEAKGCLIRVEFKNGRGGWSRYEVPDIIYHDALRNETDNKAATNRQQTDNKVASQPATELATITPSSSNYINITTTSLPEDWKKINISPLEDIGLTEKHLADILETKLATPEIVQESIYHFAYGIEHNPDKFKTYKDPLNVFIGCLRKGKPWFESTYVSPEQLALKALLEQKKVEKEQLKAMEDELMDLEFQDWKGSLTAEQKWEILPAKIIGPEDAHLRAYFLKNIWPVFREKIVPHGT